MKAIQYITITGHIWTKYRYLQAAATKKAKRVLLSRFGHLRPRGMTSHGLVSEHDISDCKAEYKYKFTVNF